MRNLSRRRALKRSPTTKSCSETVLMRLLLDAVSRGLRQHPEVIPQAHKEQTHMSAYLVYGFNYQDNEPVCVLVDPAGGDISCSPCAAAERIAGPEFFFYAFQDVSEFAVADELKNVLLTRPGLRALHTRRLQRRQQLQA